MVLCNNLIYLLTAKNDAMKLFATLILFGLILPASSAVADIGGAGRLFGSDRPRPLSPMV